MRAAVARQPRFALPSQMIAGQTQRSRQLSRIRQTARGAPNIPIGMDAASPIVTTLPRIAADPRASRRMLRTSRSAQ